MTFIGLLAVCLSDGGQACAQDGHRAVTHAKIVNGDTIPFVRLSEVRVYAKHRFKNKYAERKWTRYIYNVKKALPMARILTREFNTLNDSLALITDPLEREAFLDRQEKILFAKYEYRLKHMTVKQGRILIKLMARETGSTSYDLISLLKGNSKAFWWQAVARLFGSNLKSGYDAEDEDKYLENVVLLIDQGYY